jgi:hypothetical protein
MEIQYARRILYNGEPEVLPLLWDLCDSTTKPCPVLIKNLDHELDSWQLSFLHHLFFHEQRIMHQNEHMMFVAQSVQCFTFLRLHYHSTPSHGFTHFSPLVAYTKNTAMVWCVAKSEVCCGRYSPSPTLDLGHHNHKNKNNYHHNLHERAMHHVMQKIKTSQVQKTGLIRRIKSRVGKREGSQQETLKTMHSKE